ncbi:Mitotic spindle checkpoint component mad2 [Yamadazyma tenuis]|uniref:DNA-binding protein n=1 Tax=Candida tenuis (strain ATCC 10573 / BCRC 21748 / CBS 615 / JCM 9827 / NBRC 10315 / NRRL Y-1498 / VKM Y-70) TaxID=590646 RepID=G3BFA6_CANTC|nr:DNA-binding protein [Yamadazyma tenuis ATCC 10573]EGV60012.1 DNA-binding protein [Yamadazyma tenuis ATCC 10573]WEJ94761.1 Mitotic spindle checkpoint component mad2 [Yamadazyma tenuis]
MADSKLALKGSSKIVCDYFEFSINNILFQRGIYPADDFQTVKKYDLPLLVTIDEDIKNYINQFLSQIKRWVYGTKLQKLILVIIDKQTAEPVERWEFNLEVVEGDNQSEKSRDAIKKEIQAIIRQITSSATYLPVLDGEFTFNILVYTEQDVNNIPSEWCDTQDEKLGDQFESVDFSTFKTSLHSIGTKVSYKID